MTFAKPNSAREVALVPSSSTEAEQHQLRAFQAFVEHNLLDADRQGIAYAPNDPNEWKVPPTGDKIVIDGFSRIIFKIDSYIEPDRIMDLKMQELQRISNRSRVGSTLPPSKSKAAKRKKAKASKLARKQQRRV